MSRIGALTTIGGGGSISSVIDTTQGFAYFGTVYVANGVANGVVVKVRLSDFTQVGTLTLKSAENLPSSAVIDTGNGFAYFGGVYWTNTSHVATVVKVRLSDFTGVAAINLTENLCSGGGCSTGSAAVIDTANGFAYFAANMYPATIFKVRLSDFTVVSSLTLNSGENWVGSAVIDTANGFAYFGTGTIPGILVKIRLSDLTRVGAITLHSGENNIASEVLDSANGFIYLGLSTDPAIIVRIRLSDFTEQGALNLSPEIEASSAAIDTVNGFAYFGMYYTNPGVVAQVRLSNFTWSSALTLNYGENYLVTAVVDLPNGALYFGVFSSNLIVKVGIPSGIPGTALVDFQTNPATAGSITFNGTIYTNGQHAVYQQGSATISATSSPGYAFIGWTTSGGVYITGGTRNPATATITGPGTLTANFTKSASTQLYPVEALLAVLTITATITLERRRRR